AAGSSRSKPGPRRSPPRPGRTLSGPRCREQARLGSPPWQPRPVVQPWPAPRALDTPGPVCCNERHPRTWTEPTESRVMEARLFKWNCLGLAVVACLALGWMLNDLRLEARKSVAIINDDLPEILAKTRQATETVNANLPEIVEKTRAATETLAGLAEDVEKLKHLAGVAGVPSDKSLVAYADSLLDTVEKSKGSIGLKKWLGGKELTAVVPAAEWVVGARKEALFLVLIGRSRADILKGLSRNKFGSPGYIESADRDRGPLREWGRATPPESKDVTVGRVKPAPPGP